MRFRNVIVLQIFTLCLGLRSASLAQSVDLFESVDPFIGTSGGGNVFPGASLPFGMIQWSPDTNKQGFYDYEQKSIYGFSLTHLSGVGCPIFADMPVLPWSASSVMCPRNESHG